MRETKKEENRGWEMKTETENREKWETEKERANIKRKDHTKIYSVWTIHKIDSVYSQSENGH